MTAGASSIATTYIRVRTTSRSEKPASASAVSMIRQTALAWAPASPGWSDWWSGPASVVPLTQHPSPTTTARLYPTDFSHGPPDEIRRRSATGPPAEDDGIAADREQQRRDERRPRHDRGHVEVLRR